MVDYIKVNDLYDDTIIILQCDYGIGARGVMSEQSSRILNFLRYPPYFGDNGPMLMPDDFVVSNVDVAATIFEVTSVDPPGDYVLDGVSWIRDVMFQVNGVDSNECCQSRHIEFVNSRMTRRSTFRRSKTRSSTACRWT